MNKYRSSAELKALAKEKLDGKYSTVIVAVALIHLLTFLLASTATPVSVFDVIVSTLTSAIISPSNSP